MNIVRVRNISIGEGLPKICVPIMGRNEEEILEETRAVLEVPADIAEWRADWYEGSRREIPGILKKIRALLGNMPLIMTFRSAEEGGMQTADPESYQKICIDAIHSGCIDLIDVELSCGEENASLIIKESAAAGVKTVASSHDFEGTPDRNELTGRFLRMNELGADILKIAVMPNTRRDVAVLLEAAADAADRTEKPLIAISMGRLGVMSRIACEAFCSSVTFAAASRASAPGQPGAAELRDMILRLYEGSL